MLVPYFYIFTFSFFRADDKVFHFNKFTSLVFPFGTYFFLFYFEKKTFFFFFLLFSLFFYFLFLSYGHDKIFLMYICFRSKRFRIFFCIIVDLKNWLVESVILGMFMNHIRSGYNILMEFVLIFLVDIRTINKL